MAIETPRYRVMKKEGNIEVRDYFGYILASVDIDESNYDAATNQGFSEIADYIFGNNSKKDKVAMTAPVIQEEKNISERIAMTAPVTTSRSKNTYTVSFVMPSKYSMDTLPRPRNQRVVLKNVSPFRAAVITFSGFVNKSIIDKKTEELNAWIKQNDLVSTGSAQVARYNPPWTLWFLRRNEIMIKVKY